MSKKGAVEQRTVEQAIDEITSSAEAFNADRAKIVYKVWEDDKNYTGPVIDQINNVIFSSKKNGLQKYLALHLLKDCLDKRTPAVIDYTEKKLLSKLTKLAEKLAKAKNDQEKAKALEVTEHAKQASKFTALLLECILEWSNMFGSSNKAYKTSYDSLKKKVEFPVEKTYFKPKPSKDTGQQQQASSTRADNKQLTDSKSKPADKKPQATSTTTQAQQGSEPPSNHPLVVKSKKLIADIVNIKKYILKQFSPAEAMEKEFIEAFFDEIKTTSAELQTVAMELAEARVANSDPLVDQIYAETGPAEDIARAFERYFKETRDFSLLKMEILAILEPKKAGKNKSSKDDSQKPPIDKKASASEPQKNNEPVSQARNDRANDPKVGREETKSKDQKPNKNTEGQKKTEAGGAKSTSSKDPFGAINTTKKEEGSSNKDIFGSFIIGAAGGKSNQTGSNTGWDAPLEEKKQKGYSARQSKEQNVNDLAWVDDKAAPPKDDDEPWPTNENQGQNKQFNFDDFDNHFAEDDDVKGKEKKQVRDIVKDTFEAPKKKAGAERMQLKAKDSKEEGIIIVNNPDSFANFNFSGSGPTSQNTQPIQRDRSQERVNSHEEIPERNPVVQKKKPERKESDNLSQEAYETSDFEGREPKKNNQEQDGVDFDGEVTENQQRTGKQRSKEPRKAEAEEEEEKGGERKGLGFGGSGDAGQKKEGDDDWGDFGGFGEQGGGFGEQGGGFGEQGDEFGKGFIYGSDDIGGFREKAEKKDGDKDSDISKGNADFFNWVDKPEEESKTQKSETQQRRVNASEEIALPNLKAKKGFSFQEPLPGTGGDNISTEFSPEFKGGWETKKTEHNFSNWNLKAQQVPAAREEDRDNFWEGAVKDDTLGAFNFSNQGKKTQTNKQGGNIDIPEGLGKDGSSESAIKILLTSHIQKSALLESERAKQERDKVYNDLESVRRMYQDMRSQFEKMRTEQMQLSGNYGKVKEELTVLSQVHKGYGSEFKKLKNVAEEQKKIKNDLRQDAEQQLLKSQALNSEITQLKQQFANTDSRERKEAIQTKINELEKQLQSNTSFLQTLGAMLKVSEQEDQDNIHQISRLSEIANTGATPPRQRSPSPENKSRELSPNKAVDEVLRLKEYQNPTLISAVSLLKASRQMREQDLKAFASGQMPKVSDTPINLKISTASPLILEQKNSVRSIIPSPRKSEPTPLLTNSVVRDRFLNIDIGTGRTEWKTPSTFVSPNALSGIGLSVPKFTNNYVQGPTDDQPPSYQISMTPQNLRSQSQSQPVIDNPVLKQVSELLERSKKIRFDNSKFSLRKESDSISQAPIGSVFSDKLTTLTQTNVVSPTLNILDPNRASSYARDYVPATYTPSSYNFRKEHTQGFDFGTKSLVNFPQSETPKHLKTNLFSDQSLKQLPGFTRSSDANEEPENSLTAALERINLKSSTINLRSSRFFKENQTAKVKGQKAGRFVSYNSYLFDKLARDIEFNRNLKDADLFRYACLASKSALLDSPILQIGAISHLDRSASSYREPLVSIILHYGNKTATEMSNFNVNTAGVRDISVSSEVYGVQIASKFQLKQEFTQSFRDFNFNPATIEVSFIHNSLTNTFNVPLPFSLVKFMEFKYINFSSFKERWRALKSECVKINHRRANPKLFNDISDLNRFFSGLMIDLRSANPRTQKAKYGGFFILPDNYEYFVKFNKSSKGCKISVSTDNPNKMHAESAVQQFTFLFTVSN